MASNLPPGVTNSDIESQAAWDLFHETIDSETEKHKMSDMDAWAAWKLGVAAWKAARDMGTRFPHEGMRS